MDRYGYWNKILHVNLGDRRTWIEEPGDAFFRRYAGGRGLIAPLPPQVRAEGRRPARAGQYPGHRARASSRARRCPARAATASAPSRRSPAASASRSPAATGAPSSSARAGTRIVFHGVSPTPVYLWINDGAVEIRDAAHLWGRITGEVEDAILAELGDPRIRVAQIGPAGENLVRFACIANDLNEVAGRTGMGAVMGSKRLKAIAVRGKIPVKIADQPGAARRSPSGSRAPWTRSTAPSTSSAPAPPCRARASRAACPSSTTAWAPADTVGKVDAIAVRDQVRVRMGACYACSVRCKKVVHIEKKEEAAREASSRASTRDARASPSIPSAATASTRATAGPSTNRSPRSASTSASTT